MDLPFLAWASVAVPADADLAAIAARAVPDPARRTAYFEGRLYLADTTQEGLDAALAEVGPAPSLKPAVLEAFAGLVAAGLPIAGRAGTVALDPASRGELTAAVLMAQVGAWPAGGFWRLSDNTALPLTAPQVQALGVAAAGYYQQAFAVRSAMLDAIAAGEAVDPAAGWPEPPAFDPAD